MIFKYLLITLGLIYAVQGLCQNSKPINDFNMKKILGTWYEGALDVTDKTERKAFENSRCGVFHFYHDHKDTEPNKWDLDLIFSDKERTLQGTYYSTDPSKSLLNIYYPARNVTYSFDITCTDYETYFTFYACVDISPENTSEYLGLFLRNATEFNEIVEKNDINKCFADYTTKSVNDFRMAQSHCPNHD